MLDSGVEICSLGTNGIDCGDDLIRKHFYSFKVMFKGNPEKYTVEFHEYSFQMFVGKYYPTRFSSDKNKYALVFDENRGVIFTAKVLRTVQNIFLKVFKKYPTASFGFIGEPKKNKKIKTKKSKGYRILRDEELARTKRFQLYRKICLRDIGIKNFTLYENEALSAILLINNSNKDLEDYKRKVTEMMKRNYSALSL